MGVCGVWAGVKTLNDWSWKIHRRWWYWGISLANQKPERPKTVFFESEKWMNVKLFIVLRHIAYTQTLISPWAWSKNLIDHKSTAAPRNDWQHHCHLFAIRTKYNNKGPKKKVNVFTETCSLLLSCFFCVGARESVSNLDQSCGDTDRFITRKAVHNLHTFASSASVTPQETFLLFLFPAPALFDPLVVVFFNGGCEGASMPVPR